MRRLLPYQASRWFLLWLATDIAVTLALAASVGPAYLEWRRHHPWTLPLTLPPLAVWWLATRKPRA